MKRFEKNVPSVDWTSMGGQDHFVQFYEEDAFLLSAVSQYLYHGLKTGESVVVIATEPHRESILSHIRSFGLDPAAAEADGSLLSLDAQEMLDKFMVDGMPDEALFDATVGALVDEVSKRSFSFRFFGEMVALLNANGNCAAAMKLEEIWHELKKRYTFSLFCAYPINGFAASESGGVFDAICGHHSKVIPAESYDAATIDERCRVIAKLQQRVVELESELALMKNKPAAVVA